ncbi:ATP-binding protein [Actinokineospora diospyrosa]|uniref:Serine/threonine-protein kinase RsbW n=1 Tax=Actinokineospora diospyrosa TaxID=103728 RepID=A0ABT1IF04_9PSEU|nr:ATP-binding protein [Actinokineospora diospyrosa]MCP2271226.1 serine/threonine-protein kinase RsbW [Actinokineospora diospyrosa]
MTDPRQDLAATQPTDLGELVELRVDAALGQLPLVRTVSTAVAMRRDFDMDAIADLRLAVDEACTMLLARAVPFGTLAVRFRVDRDAVSVRCSVPVLDDAPLEESGLGWTLVSALAEHAHSALRPGEVFAELVIEFAMAPSAHGGPA